jgi:hypothetical protein
VRSDLGELHVDASTHSAIYQPDHRSEDDTPSIHPPTAEVQLDEATARPGKQWMKGKEVLYLATCTAPPQSLHIFTHTYIPAILTLLADFSSTIRPHKRAYSKLSCAVPQNLPVPPPPFAGPSLAPHLNSTNTRIQGPQNPYPQPNHRLHTPVSIATAPRSSAHPLPERRKGQ